MPLEKIAFYVQKKYMNKKISIETITIGRALFHPINRQKIVLEMHTLQCHRYQRLHFDNLWIDRDEARFYMEEKKIRILN